MEDLGMTSCEGGRRGYLDAPLILASMCRLWFQIVANYPPFWFTLIINQSEDDHLERVQLSLDSSGKGIQDGILLDHEASTTQTSKTF
jgi:hypothetical protein